MTDNRTTELREKLDERGIVWMDVYRPTIFRTCWKTGDADVYCYFDEDKLTGLFELHISGHDFTPEQAIAATQGDDDYECRMDQLLCRLTNGKWSKARSYSVDFMESCVDEAYEEVYTENATTLGTEINGETSDGYHTFNELYHHRAVLFSVIVRDHRELAWKARKHHDGTMYDGMFIVGIETPKGQATYHYDLDPYWEMFECEEREYAPEWDGHTPDDAIARIAELGSEREKALEKLVRDIVAGNPKCTIRSCCDCEHEEDDGCGIYRRICDLGLEANY